MVGGGSDKPAGSPSRGREGRSVSVEIESCDLGMERTSGIVSTLLVRRGGRRGCNQTRELSHLLRKSKFMFLVR